MRSFSAMIFSKYFMLIMFSVILIQIPKWMLEVYENSKHNMIEPEHHVCIVRVHDEVIWELFWLFEKKFFGRA
jgi:hypothetical protein